jgi:hypothetical protein
MTKRVLDHEGENVTDPHPNGGPMSESESNPVEAGLCEQAFMSDDYLTGIALLARELATKTCGTTPTSSWDVLARHTPLICEELIRLRRVHHPWQGHRDCLACDRTKEHPR